MDHACWELEVFAQIVVLSVQLAWSQTVHTGFVFRSACLVCLHILSIPDLLASVEIAIDVEWWEMRNYVSIVDHSFEGDLRGDVVGEGSISDSRLAISVKDVKSAECCLDIKSSDHCNCSSQTVSGDINA